MPHSYTSLQLLMSTNQVNKTINCLAYQNCTNATENNITVCEMKGNQCRPKCNVINDTTACNSTHLCYWNNTNSSCLEIDENYCSSATTIENCRKDANDYCYFNNSKCEVCNNNTNQNFKLISYDGKRCYTNTIGCEAGYQQGNHSACLKYCEINQNQNNQTHKCEFCPKGQIPINGYCINETLCTGYGGSIQTLNESTQEFIGLPGNNETKDKYCSNATPNEYADGIKFVQTCNSTVHENYYNCLTGEACVQVNLTTIPKGRCIECQQGTYANNSQCTKCQPGNTTNGTNQTSCAIACNNGSITNSHGQCVTSCSQTEYQKNNQCVGCDLGYQATTKDCQKCPKSYYRSAQNTTCQRCDNNMTTPYDGAIYKQECWMACSQYQFIDHQGNCVAQCPEGSYTLSNSSYCQTCSIGEQYDKVTKSCQKCPRRYYKSIFNITCQKCPNTNTTEQIGSIDISNCTVQCAQNQYLELDGTCVTVCGPREKINNKECELCTTNQYVQQDRKQCLSSCPAGQIPDPTTFVCGPCPAGTKQIEENGQRICQSCPPGQVSNQSATTCTSCLKSQYVKNNTCTTCPTNTPFVLDDFSGCTLKCPDGQTPNQNQICTNCSQFISANHLLCVQKCPSGQGILATTYRDVSTFSQSSAKQCSVCPPGMFGNSSSNQCEKCQNGTFTSLSGQSSCTRCKPGFASKPDLTGCINNCQNGYVMSNGVCLPCASGQVSINNECTYCPPMSIPSKDLGSCVPCGLREYAKPGDTLCTACANLIASTLDSCVTKCGTYEYVITGGFQCVECPPGAYASSGASQSGYIQCPGTTLVSATIDGCVDVCTPGQYVDENRRCHQCPPGSVSPGNGAPCVECGILAQPDEQQAICIHCSKYQVSTEENGFICSLCPDRTFYNEANQSCDSSCNKNEMPGNVDGAPVCIKCKTFQMSPDGLNCVQDVALVRTTALSAGIPVAVLLLIGIIIGIICCVKTKRKQSRRVVTGSAVSMDTPITFTYDEMFEKTENTKIIY